MVSEENREMFKLMQKLFTSHPWHGVSSGRDAPDIVNVYIEIVPADTFKYEVAKKSGFLKVDRPQQYSNICPQMYGFIPQTYCMENVSKLCEQSTGIKVVGDEDPLDICVLAERPITHGNILVTARPIGGLRMIDKGEADDKIIAVLEGDAMYKHIRDIDDCPPSLIERLSHYFHTYKLPPGGTEYSCQIPEVYGCREAKEVVKASMRDYETHYPGLVEALKRCA